MALILIGVAAWVPYGVLKYALGQEVEVYPFLGWHLAGVVPGVLLRRGDMIWRWLSRKGPSGGG